MNIDEVKNKVDVIVTKKENQRRFRKLKDFIDERTNPSGLVTITVEKETFTVDPVDLKKLINKRIDDEDTTADEAELIILANG
jgi:hypothetical protein